MTRPGVVIVGIHGHGATHVDNVLRLEAAGACTLAATVDPIPSDGLGEVPHFADLGQCLEAVEAAVVILATPIGTHAALARTALEAGADLLLEKPPTASLAELQEVIAVAERTGGLVQVGFQALGSEAVPALRDLWRSGALGELTGVAIEGTWLRNRGYWTRAPWAGRRTMNGRPVVDGVLTNPLAHSFASALAILGCDAAGGVTGVDLDQYHVNPIEADDTSVARLSTSAGITVTAALTLCSSAETDPTITLLGTEGEATLWYTRDVARVRRPGAAPEEAAETSYGRADLLTNLLAARRGEEELLVPLSATEGFMTLLEAVRTAPAPRQVAPEHVEWRDDEHGVHPVLRDVEAWCRRCSRDGATFAEAGAPWAAG